MTPYAEILAERERQDEKWGPVSRFKSQGFERALVILMEEVGEAARAVLEMHPVQNRLPGDWRGQARRELIQVAAVAVAIIEYIDLKEADDDHSN